MKSFTTPEYINPILEEIRRSYTPQYNKKSLAALDCVAILKSNKGRDCIALRTPDKGGFNYFGYSAMLQLLRTMETYKKAVETYAGELDGWMYAEERRAMEAVRTALIDEYRKPRKTA